jgi:hypothetical protein
MIEALRAIPGIKQTDTRIVLKKHRDGRRAGSNSGTTARCTCSQDQEAAWVH